MERRKHIKNYFDIQPAKFPSFTEQLMKVALAVFAFGIFVIIFFQNTLVIGILCIIAAVIVGYYWLKPYYIAKAAFFGRPETEIMHEWLIEDLNVEVKKRAISSLVLDESKLQAENFIIIPYPIYWQTTGVAEPFIKRRQGADGKFAYSIWGVQVLAITENYLSIYSCNYDWVNNLIANERTNEYFYQDIASISNDVEPLSFKLKGEQERTAGEAKIFRISHMSGTMLSIISDIPSLNCSPVTKTSLDKAVQVIRIILRNRRFGEIIEMPKPTEEQHQEH